MEGGQPFGLGLGLGVSGLGNWVGGFVLVRDSVPGIKVQSPRV